MCLFGSPSSQFGLPSYQLESQCTPFRVSSKNVSLLCCDKTLSRTMFQQLGPLSIRLHASAAHIRRNRCVGSRNIEWHWALLIDDRCVRG
mmetsp:Transcript_7700/g.19014  ORF Transcript_7700/g.19014 Transcript_7700/m.19014 type:complete len:90 (-) Transcript_7700:999-1268(-)